MLTKEAYAYYEAGTAVAAVYLRLAVKQVSISPMRGSTEIVLPRDGLKTRMILWLTGLAAEKKGVGETDAFRRMKCRRRILGELSAQRRSKESRAPAEKVLSQAQDRANAVCSSMFPAIREVAQRLLADEVIAGSRVTLIVSSYRKQRALQNGIMMGEAVSQQSAVVKRQEA